MHNLMNIVLLNKFGTLKIKEEEAVPEPTSVYWIALGLTIN